MKLSLDRLAKLTDLWVFGYGSLLWNPGFSFVEERIGYIEGYSRKFWQGNIAHRGRPGKPGRVVTLIEEIGARVWGRAFHVVGTEHISLCLEHLGLRECLLGGYDIDIMDFTVYDEANVKSDISRDIGCSPYLSLKYCDVHHNDLVPTYRCINDNYYQNKNNTNNSNNNKTSNSEITTDNQLKLKTLTFVALPENELYVGPALPEEMANCLLHSEGPHGPNLDYMLGILEFLKYRVPEEEMVFEKDFLDIEQCIWSQLQKEGLTTVSNCRGFYHKEHCKSESKSGVGDINQLVSGQRGGGFYTGQDKCSLANKNNLFTPLLHTIRKIEMERNSFEQSQNRDSEGLQGSPVPSLNLKDMTLWSSSEEEEDEGISTALSSAFSSLSSIQEKADLSHCFHGIALAVDDQIMTWKDKRKLKYDCDESDDSDYLSLQM